ncbi:uncharacterized protein [Epargyreus clarus]|uniref:uncharacterized protein n=1 Tax=Epargyreus clarus TaxID=520877 RepID=UPI003C2F98CE
MERSEQGLLKDWSKEDKLSLYHSIKTHGSQNIEHLQECLPDKSIEAIQDAINFYKKKALREEGNRNIIKEHNRQFNQPHIPLNSWAKLLTETIPFVELQTETATALRIIADFENIPQAVCTEKIDFKKVYHMLANALEGKPLCEDKLIAAVIDKCIIETALTSKAFMKSPTYKNALQNIRIYDKEFSPFVKPTENNELTIMRQIVMQKNYNPLNIPEHHLKYSFLT